MEVYEAKVIQKDENCLLEFTLKDKKLEIPLTEDNPNAVKSFFNKLIIELKNGEFEFNLVEQEEKNLYRHNERSGNPLQSGQRRVASATLK